MGILVMANKERQEKSKKSGLLPLSAFWGHAGQNRICGDGTRKIDMFSLSLALKKRSRTL
jgi:hypothetical protein